MLSPSTRIRLVAGTAGLALVGVACGSDSGGIQAADAWARTSPMNAEAGAAYMVLTSDEEVTITSAEVSSDVAGRVELHETVAMDDAMADTDEHDHDDHDHEGEEKDDEAMGDMEDNDEHEGHDHGDDEAMGDMAMMMQELDGGITIPADEEVTLEPGGLHVMMLDLAEPLESGDTFDLTLNTDDGEAITVSVEVRDDAP